MNMRLSRENLGVLGKKKEYNQNVLLENILK